MQFETKAIHVGEEPNFKEGGYGDVVSPIHLSSTFARERVNTPTQGYEYSRSKNPTRDALEKRLASLENADYGLAFASGLSAEASIFLALLKPNDHIIAFDDLYGGTKRLFNRILKETSQLQFSYVDARDLSLVESQIQKNTKCIWLETPTNPLLKICDIQAISKLAHQHQLFVVVDNTFMSPYFQNPLDLGADIVMHSSTKYINGHSDSIGGCLMLNNPAFYEKLKFVQNGVGAVLSPFDSYLVLRGIKTLAVRMKEHEKNAKLMTSFLSNHPLVEKVIYPGLATHTEHALAQKQMRGFGGMISFELKGNSDACKKFVENLKYCYIAESLGGVESLIEVPAIMTHASVSPTEREKIGLKDSLIRFSVGIEASEDLIKDFEQAFQTIKS